MPGLRNLNVQSLFWSLFLLIITSCGKNQPPSPPGPAAAVEKSGFGNPPSSAANFVNDYPADNAFAVGQIFQVSNRIEMGYEKWPLKGLYRHYFPSATDSNLSCNLQTEPIPHAADPNKTEVLEVGTQLEVAEISSKRTLFQADSFSNVAISFRKTNNRQLILLCQILKPTLARAVTYGEVVKGVESALLVKSTPSLPNPVPLLHSLLALDWFQSGATLKANLELEFAATAWQVAFQEGKPFFDPAFNKSDFKKPQCRIFAELNPASTPLLFKLTKSESHRVNAISINRDINENGLGRDHLFFEMQLDLGWSMGCYSTSETPSPTNPNEISVETMQKILGENALEFPAPITTP